MDRRGFLGKVGLGAAAVIAAPIAARLINWDAIPSPPPVPSAGPLNTSYRWYTGYDSFDPPTSAEVLDAAEYQWKQLGGFISTREVSGDYEMVVRDRIVNLQRSFAQWEREVLAALPQS